MSDPSEPLLSEKPLRPSSLDDTLEKWIGEFGAAQLMQAILVSLAWTFDAQHTFINIFADAQPTWHCANQLDLTCTHTKSVCAMDDSSFMWAWDRPAWSSTVSEWNLACISPLLLGLPPSCFFVGCLVGGLVLATLADSSLGRKNMLLLSSSVMAITGILTATSPNIWFYSFCRFLSGFSRSTVGTSALVLSTELVGKRYRGEIGIIGFFMFTIGFLSLPLSAYLLQDYSWRFLYLFASIPCLLYCVFLHLFVFESPRWLIIKRREMEAVETLRNIAKTNGRSVDFVEDGLASLFISYKDHADVDDQDVGEDQNVYAAIMILLNKRWAFRRLIAVMICGFGVGLVYYGMPLAVGDLNFNLYVSVTLNALAELPAALITFCMISRLNRRTSILFFTSMSGVLSVLCVVTVVPETQMVAEVISFFCACSAFNILLIYCLELFPTSVRNSAVSLLRQALVLGGAFSPLLVVAGRREKCFSFGVFAMVILGSGLFVICLPDTRGAGFCDTMEEQESKDHGAVIGCKKGSIESAL